MGQLPDEKLQKGGSVVLLELVPWKRAVVEGGLELLAQRLGWMHSHTQEARYTAVSSLTPQNERHHHQP